jgi:small subunit ribosomal protein S1
MEKIDETIEKKDVTINNSDEKVVEVPSEQPVETVEQAKVEAAEIVNETPATEVEVKAEETVVEAVKATEELTAEKVEETEESATEVIEETEESSFEHMLEESLANIQQLDVGDKVSGEILNITDSYIFVSLGGKRDAYAEKTDYKDKKGNINYKIGDILKGYVVKYSETETLISKSLLAVNLRVLEEAFEGKVPIRGKVTSLTKGGYNIDISGIRVFCPLSHIDGKLVTDPQQFVSETYDFRIIDFKDNGRNIVVSRRVILDEEKDKIKQETLAKLSIGSVLQGIVTRLTSFGAFVDLGGIEGLLHISQFSWTHIDSPSDVLNIGDKIEAKIIKLKGEKVSLSMKALQENPMDKAFEELQAGDIVKCKVLRNLPFGSFVEIKSGVEGLIPISELTRGHRVASPSEVVTEGDLVEAQILRVDKEKRKISLSLKSLQPDPWDNLNQELAANDIVTGIVENVANFGVFVKIKDGVTGLLPNVKLKTAGEKLDKANIGQEYKVRIVKIDMAEKRISLEPSNMPESVYEAKDDWNKYKKHKLKKEDIIEDNPFANL